MPTKLNQNQVDGLPSDLDSLESFISAEDSAGDSADVSQDGVIDSIEAVIGSTGTFQTQIDMLKTTLGNYIYSDPVMYQIGDTFYFAGTMQYPILTTTEFKWYYTDDMEVRNFIEISGETGSTLTPTGEFADPSYGYYLEVTYTSDLGVFQKDSQQLTYVPV
jgi:hypothetical protein